MKNKPLFAKASVSTLCVMFSCYSLSVSAANSTGNVTVDGEKYTVTDYNKIDINGDTVVIEGTSQGLSVFAPGSSASISGKDKVSITGSSLGMYIDPSKGGQGSAQVDVLAKEISITGGSYALWSTYRSTVNIGSSETESLNLSGQIIVTSNKATGDTEWVGSQVKLEAKTINITSDGEYALHAFHRTQEDEAPEGATTLTVIADDIFIKGKKLGVSAHSNGQVEIIGNLTVNAPHAIDARGNSTITINEDRTHTVKLDGDIVFETPGPQLKSGDIVNAYVNVNLAGADSYWTGTVYKDLPDNLDNDQFTVSGFNLTLADGATWNAKVRVEETYKASSTDDKGNVTEWNQNVTPLAVNNLTLNDGVINIQESTEQVVKIDTLSGSGGTINTVATTTDGKTVKAGHLSVDTFKLEDDSNFTINVVDGMTADDVTDQAEAGVSAYTAVLGKEAKVAASVTFKEDLASGDVIVNITPDGTVTVQEAQNTVNSSILDIASSNYLFFRSQINDVSARMGDLRSMPKTAGAWVRYYGGQNKYSDKGQKEKYNTLQLGADAFINNNFYLGGTFSYTDGDGTLRNGSTDDKNYNFGIYSGWVGDAGQFVDVIIKRHRVETDFDLYNTSGLVSSGSYHNWGTSASVEAGWRLQCPNTGFYAEPQVELQLGRLDSVNHRTSKGVNVQQDGIDSIIGRAGVAVGYTFPDNKGTAYAKASVLHDWKGEVKSTFSANGQTRTYKDDLGGTWGEFAVGGTYNPTQNLSAYGQVKTSTGSPVRNPWQVSVGLRYNF